MRYLKTLAIAIMLLAALPYSVNAQQQKADTEQLGKALEYFKASKYHESLLIFRNLDKKYKLNPRFRAYIGLCYYYEWDYPSAVRYFNKVLPELQGLSPHELSVYYYAAAESYFQMQKYDSAKVYFERDFAVCYDNEKGDVCYRIGLCEMFAGDWRAAYNSYTKSERYYRRFRNIDDLKARLTQIAKMKNGCRNEIAKLIDAERSSLLRVQTESEKYSPWDSATVVKPDDTWNDNF